MNDVGWIRGSAWLALGLWAWAEILLARELRPARRGWASPATRVWAAGALALGVHFLIAFGLRHRWSHAAAVADTALQTEARFGLRWGGGVWINYLLLAWWGADVLRLGMHGPDAGRPGGWVLLRVACFVFLWFQGAFVFGRGPWRWLGLMACVGVAGAWGIRWWGWRGRARREAGAP